MTISDVQVRDDQEQLTAVIRHRISLRETSRIPEWIEKTLEAVQAQGDGEGPAGNRP